MRVKELIIIIFYIIVVARKSAKNHHHTNKCFDELFEEIFVTKTKRWSLPAARRRLLRLLLGLLLLLLLLRVLEGERELLLRAPSSVAVSYTHLTLPTILRV